MNSKKILHISHNDLDGYGCTILTNILIKGYPEGMFELSEMHILPSFVYKTISDIILEINLFNNDVNGGKDYDRIIVTDLAINKPTAELIQKSYPDKFIWIDHHECKIPADALNTYEWLSVMRYIPEKYYDEGIGPAQACATWLYYKFLLSDPVFNINILQFTDMKYIDFFAETVRMYDTYEFKKFQNSNTGWALAADDAPRLNTLFHTFEKGEFTEYIENYIRGKIPFYSLTNSSMDYPWISKILEISQKENDRYVRAAMKKVQFLKFDYTFKNGEKVLYNIALVFAERNGPAIGNAVCVENPNVDITIVVTNNQASLYTIKDEVDVSKLATAFNGGGHKRASGFSIPYGASNRLERIRFESMLSVAEKSDPNKR